MVALKRKLWVSSANVNQYIDRKSILCSLLILMTFSLRSSDRWVLCRCNLKDQSQTKPPSTSNQSLVISPFKLIQFESTCRVFVLPTNCFYSPILVRSERFSIGTIKNHHKAFVYVEYPLLAKVYWFTANFNLPICCSKWLVMIIPYWIQYWSTRHVHLHTGHDTLLHTIYLFPSTLSTSSIWRIIGQRSSDLQEIEEEHYNNPFLLFTQRYTLVWLIQN